MIDKEVIIFQIEDMLSNINKENFLLNGGHIDNGTAFLELMTNVLTLLKEQEAVEPINSYGTFRCGNCKNIVGYNDGHGHGYQNNFCSKCGKAIKWNKNDY